MKKTYQRDLPHVRIYEWMAKSPAYRSLSVYSRCLYHELKRRYSGSNNGAIPLAFREAMELVGCSNRPLQSAFAELQEKGFIRPIQKGHFGWKLSVDGKGRATTWLLTEYKADHPTPSISASKEFMRWSEAKLQNKSRCDESTPTVCADHTMPEQVVCGERTSSVTRAHDERSNPTPDSVTRAYTYSTPYGGDASDAA